MSKTWIQTEDLQWINLEHAYHISVRGNGEEWEIWVYFMRDQFTPCVIGSHKTKEQAYADLEDLMGCLRLGKI